MAAFGKILLARSGMLLIIAFCIVVAVMNEDRNVRLLAAVTAIVVEIIRDAILVSGMGGKPQANKQ